MTDAEKQIRIHQSEKETFSKGIASIIYNSQEIVNKDEHNQIDEKNSSIEEIIEKSETIEVKKEMKSTTAEENKIKLNVLEDENKGLSQSLSHQEQLCQQNVCPIENTERRRSESPSKNIGKKVMNGIPKKGARFTVIGGQIFHSILARRSRYGVTARGFAGRKISSGKEDIKFDKKHVSIQNTQKLL